jgi:hypothetical protein
MALLRKLFFRFRPPTQRSASSAPLNDVILRESLRTVGTMAPIGGAVRRHDKAVADIEEAELLHRTDLAP